MRKWMLVVIGLVAVLVGFAVVAVTNLESYLNRNRDWLARQAEQALGREVGFGEIGVSLSGGLGVRVRDVSIADDPRFSDEPVVEARSALVRVRVLPALFGRYEIARVVLEAPAIHVVRTTEGLNVATLGKPDTGAAEEEGAERAAFVIAVVDVDDGRVRYADRTAEPPAEIVVEQIDFSASDVSMEDPLSFELAAAALGAGEQNVRAEGTIGPLDVPDSSQIAVDVDLETDSLSMDDLARIQEIAAALPPEATVTGPLTLSAHAGGTVGALTFHATLDGEDARIRYGDTLDKPAGVPFRVDVQGRRGADAIAVENAAVRLHEAELEAKGTVAAGESSAYRLAITSNAIPLSNWGRLLSSLEGTALEGTLRLDLSVSGDAGSETPALSGTVAVDDFGAKREGVPAIADLSTTATLSGDKVAIAPATFLLGGAPAELTASVTSLKSPAVAFKVTSQAMPAAALGAAAEQAGGDEVLRDLVVEGSAKPTDAGMDVRVKASSPSGMLRGIDYRDLAADVRLEEGRAVLDPVSMRAFGGTLRGEGVYDMREQVPSFNFDSQVSDIRIGDALAAFGGSAARFLEGTFEADLKLAGVGDDWDTISRALTGGGRISLTQGALKDVNLVDGVIESLTGVPGLSSLIAPELRQKYPRLFASGDTVFDALEGRFSVTDGKMRTENLVIRAAEYLVSGRGGIGFDKSVDLAAGVSLSSELSKDLIARADVVRFLAGDDGRVYVPFRLDGTLPAARPRPDIDYVAHALQRGAVKGFVDGIIEGAKSKGSTPPPAGDGAEDETAPEGSRAGEGAPAQAPQRKPRGHGAAPPPPEQPAAGEKPAEGDRPPADTPEERLRRGLEGLFGR